MDALGWRIADAYGFLHPALPVRRPLRTTLGYSSGAIPTILTGVPPSVHGHWNLLYYDPKGSPFRWLQRLPPALVQRLDGRYGRFALGWAGRHLFGLGPSFECAVRPVDLPWFNWAEKKHLYQPGSLAPYVSVFDEWEQARLPYAIYSYRDGDDWHLLRRAQRDVAQGRARVIFLYLCGLDHSLHCHRDNPAAMRADLQRYAAGIGQLHAAAHARDPHCVFRVFSDHGMAPVSRRVPLRAELERRGWRLQHDYLAVLDSTMLRFWFFEARARADIEDWLRTLDCGRVLEEPELRRQGVWFPDSRFGELIFLLDAGCMVSEGAFNGRGWNPAGMHGYDPADGDSDAVLLSNAAADAGLTRIQDLYGCLCEPLRDGQAA
ncbi:MAG: alkaline phosphatase family protein [Terriglobales bacterium]